MEAIDLRALEEAVTVFYGSASSEQAIAHEWLTKVQNSPQAWSFVWDLMAPGKPPEIQFFGATTLHSKLMKFWHEVPKANHDELKQKLLETIVTFGGGPKIVLNRLCIALSALIVHMMKEWTTAIEDIANTFQNQQLPNLTQNTQIWIMMEVLCGIPEETNAIYTSVQRATLRNDINKRAPFVMQIIERYISSKCDTNLETSDMTTLLRAAKCAGVWLKNGGFPLDTCQFLASSLLKLINTCYWNNNRNDPCMTADENELTEACLETLAAMMIQPDAHRYSNTALSLMRLFLESLSGITKAEWTENNLNEDIAVGIYTLFISSIECHSRLLIAGVLSESIEHRELYMGLVHEILQCTDKPGIYPVEESCSTLAMGFWYMMQDEVLSKDNDAELKKALELITPLYSHLAKIIVRKAQQPDENSIDKWSADDLETFRCYRQDISDTLMYCYEVLHGGLLDILSSLLDDSIAAIQNDSMNWTKLEACVFAFYSVAEQVDSHERKNIPKLMSVLHDIPYDKLNEKLLGTALETIGGYCEWFKDNPNFIPSAIELLVKGLNSSMASQATLGLKDLSRECQLELRNYAEPLLSACQQSLLGGRLKNSESVRLMFSIGKIMSMLPADKIPMCLDSMVSPCFQELMLLTQERNVSESSKIRTLFRLNMISTLFSSLNINTDEDDCQQASANDKGMQPVLFVMQKTMPIFKDIASQWINEQSVVEGLCSALKHAIVNLMNDFKPMLPDLCYLIISILQSKCVAPAVEISKTCILLFYKDPPCQPIMEQLMVEVILYTLKLFEETPSDGFSNISDLVEAFFNFNAQIVKKIPNAFSNPRIDCLKLFIYGMKAITMPEMGPVKNAIGFLTYFIMQSRNFPNMTTTVLEKGEELIKTTLLCIGVLTARTQVDVYADIFVAINKKYPSELIVWMKILEVTQFPTNLISDQEKEQFMKNIIREKVNKRLVQGFIREFSAKCRGLLEKF